MKKLLFFIGIVVFMSSCSTYQHYFDDEYTRLVQGEYDPTSLLELQFLPHQKEVKVFKDGDTLSQKYLKTHYFQKFTTKENLELVISELQQEAQYKGIDALLVLDKKANLQGNEHQDNSSTYLAAYGIKYLKNVKSELINRPVKAYLSLFDNEYAYYDVVDSFEISPYGELIPSYSNNFYSDYYHIFSLDFMLHEKDENWRYQRDEVDFTVIKKRRDRQRTKLLTFDYDSLKRVKSIDYKTASNHYWIDFLYKNEQLERKEIYSFNSDKTKELDRTEHFQYHRTGQLTHHYIFKHENSKRPIPFLKLQYIYWRDADFDRIWKEQNATAL